MVNNVPNETVFFLKMLIIINYSNPVFYKTKFADMRKPAYPVDNIDSSKIANYVIHSEKFQRVASFMLYDHVNDEIRLTSRFSTENSFKIFKTKQLYKSQVFDRHIKITIVK